MEHQLRVQKMEDMFEDHVEKIKKTIENRFKESNKLLQFQKQKQKLTLNYEANHAKTFALKSELESGLDLWRKQVLSIQSQSIRRAEEWVRSELERRRGKLAEEMRSREQKCLEKRKENEAEEELNALNTKKKIAVKEKKV